MGRERRRTKRIRKRLQVRFWNEDGIDSSGFTADVSETGLFVETMKEVPPGTRLHLEIALEAKPYYAECVVARVRKVHPSAKAVKRSGFGVRMVGFAEAIRVISDVTPGSEAPFSVDLRDPAELKRIFDRDIKLGALTITSETAVKVEDEVQVCVLLPDPQGQVVVKGTVTAELPSLPGFGISLQEADQIRGLVHELIQYAG
jgi:Tfp pilus assembly protein PilZ